MCQWITGSLVGSSLKTSQFLCSTRKRVGPEVLCRSVRRNAELVVGCCRCHPQESAVTARAANVRIILESER